MQLPPVSRAESTFGSNRNYFRHDIIYLVLLSKLQEAEQEIIHTHPPQKLAACLASSNPPPGALATVPPQ